MRETRLVQNPRGRTYTSLNGRWRVIVDPYDAGGFRQVFKDNRPGPGSERIEYDFDSSPLLHVPGDWNSQDERLFFYEGSVWYRRRFQCDPPSDGARVRLRFDGANYRTVVYLNAEPLGEHVGGFGPFEFDVTDELRAGENSLVVQVENRRSADAVPALLSDWWNYGGLTRDVGLIELPATCVLDYTLALAADSDTRVDCRVQLSGDPLEQRVRVRVPELDVDVSADADAFGEARLAFEAPLELWLPDSPRCYAVTIEAAGDRVQDRIGFRRVEARGTEIFLNGRPIFLRGISIHEEAPTRPGRAWSEEDARTLLGWALELGCNFVRLAHYPHNEHMARVADELGLLVWAEIPVYWAIQWTREETLENARQQLRELIERDRNRASVVLWSLANETPQNPERLEFLSNLAELARELDPTRLITAALLTRPTSDTTYRIEDPLSEHVDVVGVNEYFGWYYGDKAKLDEMRFEIADPKPVIMSELGAGALAGHRGGPDDRWTEDFQADFYVRQLRMLEKVPFLAGLTPWILKDFRAPIRTLPGIQDYFNRKGLVSERGQRKRAFGVLRDFYGRIRGLDSSRSGSGEAP